MSISSILKFKKRKKIYVKWIMLLKLPRRIEKRFRKVAIAEQDLDKAKSTRKLAVSDPKHWTQDLI
jgi:hypothetical protein